MRNCFVNFLIGARLPSYEEPPNSFFGVVGAFEPRGFEGIFDGRGVEPLVGDGVCGLIEGLATGGVLTGGIIVV